MTKPIIAVGALGGTIAMTAAERGGAVSPGLDAAGLVAAVPDLEDIAEIRARTIRNVASPSIVVEDVLEALAFANEAVEGGAAGVVLTHGTDTLEETSYLLDLLWDREEPIVVTGAMRAPSLLSPDGAANLLSAVVTAAAEDARGLGVIAMLDDSVHLARYVAKTDSTGLSTFQSPGWGRVGRIVERRLRLAYRPARRFDALPAPPAGNVNVPLVESTFADDGGWLRLLVDARPAAIVVSGSGVGHLSVPAADVAEEAIGKGIPVILASRTGSGSTLEKTYGYPGSEQDLLRRGVIGAGFLNGRKARLLAHVVTAAGGGEAELRKEFAARGW